MEEKRKIMKCVSAFACVCVLVSVRVRVFVLSFFVFNLVIVYVCVCVCAGALMCAWVSEYASNIFILTSSEKFSANTQNMSGFFRSLHSLLSLPLAACVVDGIDYFYSLSFFFHVLSSHSILSAQKTFPACTIFICLFRVEMKAEIVHFFYLIGGMEHFRFPIDWKSYDSAVCVQSCLHSLPFTRLAACPCLSVCVCIFHEFPVLHVPMWQLKLYCDTMATKSPILFCWNGRCSLFVGLHHRHHHHHHSYVQLTNTLTRIHSTNAHTLTVQRLRSFLTHTNAKLKAHILFFDLPISHLLICRTNGSKHV